MRFNRQQTQDILTLLSDIVNIQRRLDRKLNAIGHKLDIIEELEAIDLQIDFEEQQNSI